LDKAVLQGLGEDLLAVESATVVGDGNDDLARLVIGGDADVRGWVLAGGEQLLGSLDTVADRVAHHVEERIGELFGDGLVEFGVFSSGLEYDLFDGVAGDVARCLLEL